MDPASTLSFFYPAQDPAIPKSTILIFRSPLDLRRTFSNLRSLWTTPLLWQ